MSKEKKETKAEPLEKQLWKAADKLRKNIDAAEYKHVVLGLIFLKYISDSFEEMYTKLNEGKGDYAGADPEDKDEYKAENIFFVPPEARWSYLVAHVDAAMIANPPFNVSDWSGELLRNDGRWKYGAPPAGNANFAWLQHFIHHLAPSGRAGVVLAKGALTSKTRGEVRVALDKAVA